MDLILSGSMTVASDLFDIQCKASNYMVKEKRDMINGAVSTVSATFSVQYKCLFEISSEKDASSWLSVLPIEDHGFICTKVPSGMLFAIDMVGNHLVYLLHVFVTRVLLLSNGLSCPNGGYTIFHHNNLRGLTTQLLNEICNNVSTELPLQPVLGELFTFLSG